LKKILDSVTNYYSDKVKEHGASPEGVDWNDISSQTLRFKILSDIISSENFTIADIGCGYGSYIDFLRENYKKFSYIGYDLSEEMIEHAKYLYSDKGNFQCVESLDQAKQTDYSIASGIFNVKMHFKKQDWMQYIVDTLDVINSKSIKGFSFNMLTKYSDEEYMREDLYYADPLFFFDYCKSKYSKNISLRHDYGLYEFTILVRKNLDER